MSSGPIAPEGQISLLLAHRYALIREGIARIIKETDFQLIGEVDSMEELYRALPQGHPDLLLLDWNLAEDPNEAVRTLTQEKFPNGAVVLISRPENTESILSVMQAGARGCLSLNLTGEEFIARLHMLAKGDFIISHELAPALLEKLASKDSREAKDDLSDREREVLTLLSYGATNREIAEELIITENTVKVHLRHILEKLDLRNRQQAAAYAVREGLVEPADESPDSE